MSKHETPMTRWYWSQVGGTLVEEFPLTPRTQTSQLRLLDGLILPDGEKRVAGASDVDLAGKRVIAVQTKAANLGMNVLGQTLFSQLLLYRNYHPAHVEGVALCSGDDDVLRELAMTFPDIRVVIAPAGVRS